MNYSALPLIKSKVAYKERGFVMFQVQILMQFLFISKELKITKLILWRRKTWDDNFALNFFLFFGDVNDRVTETKYNTEIDSSND